LISHAALTVEQTVEYLVGFQGLRLIISDIFANGTQGLKDLRWERIGLHLLVSKGRDVISQLATKGHKTLADRRSLQLPAVCDESE